MNSALSAKGLEDIAIVLKYEKEGDYMKRKIIHSILSFFTNAELLEQLEMRKTMKK